jgi:hypothetical protein
MKNSRLVLNLLSFLLLAGAGSGRLAAQPTPTGLEKRGDTLPDRGRLLADHLGGPEEGRGGRAPCSCGDFTELEPPPWRFSFLLRIKIR